MSDSLFEYNPRQRFGYVDMADYVDKSFDTEGNVTFAARGYWADAWIESDTVFDLGRVR